MLSNSELETLFCFLWSVLILTFSFKFLYETLLQRVDEAKIIKHPT
jgi:hypothetical protein